jgi:hypothetical protein
MAKILFVNSDKEADGLTDYGRRFNHVIQQSQKHKVKYIEVSHVQNIEIIATYFKPDIVIYNYHKMTFPYLPVITKNGIGKYKQVLIYHEYGNDCFSDAIIHVDTTKTDDVSKQFFSVPRPLYDTDFKFTKNDIPHFGSYGFGGHHKNFDFAVHLIVEQFEEAVINFNIPCCHFDYDINIRKGILNNCKQIVKDSGKNIKINISEDFLNYDDLIKFLNKNDCIIFMHADRDNIADLTLSASTDYALMAKKPIALSKSNMFRHFENVNPSVYAADRSLIDIINSGIEPLQSMYEANGTKAFLEKFEWIIDNLK